MNGKKLVIILLVLGSLPELCANGSDFGTTFGGSLVGSFVGSGISGIVTRPRRSQEPEQQTVKRVVYQQPQQPMYYPQQQYNPELDNLRRENYALKSELLKSQNVMQQAQQQIHGLEQDKAKMHQDISQLKQEQTKKEKRITEFETQLKDLEAAIKAQRVAQEKPQTETPEKLDQIEVEVPTEMKPKKVKKAAPAA